MLGRSRQDKTCWSIFGEYFCRCSPVKLLLVFRSAALVLLSKTSTDIINDGSVSVLRDNTQDDNFPKINLKRKLFRPQFISSPPPVAPKKSEHPGCKVSVNGVPS